MSKTKQKKLEEDKKFFRSYKFKVVTILNMVVKYDGQSKKAVIPITVRVINFTNITSNTHTLASQSL